MSETMVSGGDNAASDEWKDFDFSTVKVEQPRVTRAMPRREILRFVVVGLFSGMAVWLGQLAIENWAMHPLFCRTPDTVNVCNGADVTSFVIALVVVGVVAATILASQRVFRAVVITAAVFTSLGALWPLLNNRGAVAATVVLAILAAALYLFFALIAAIKRYTMAVILTVALVVGFWLLARA